MYKKLLIVIVAGLFGFMCVANADVDAAATAVAGGVAAAILAHHKNSDSNDSRSNNDNLIKQIVDNMTLEQKLGQMTLPKYMFLQPGSDTINFGLIQKYYLGAILAAGGEVPNGKGGVLAGLDEPQDYMSATQANWQKLNSQVNNHPVRVQLKSGEVAKIHLLLGVDAVHGEHNVLGNVTFPQNIGLSMSHDPDLFNKIGKAVAQDMGVTDFNWAYAPTIAISHNPQWGRTSETLGSIPSLTSQYADAYISGLQQNSLGGHINGVLATAKHFLGDGATYNGIDQGNDHVQDMQRFLQVNDAGYIGAIKANVGSVMVSYSAINGTPMSINASLLASLYSNNFNGFLVSDYGAVDKVSTQALPTKTYLMPYNLALAESVDSGMDMIMITSTSPNYKTAADFLQIFKQDVDKGLIPMSRINEAVTRILTVKQKMGLIQIGNDEQLKGNKAATISRQQEIDLATQSAEQSLVLLKNNNNVLPLAANNIKYVVLAGESLIQVRQDNGSRKLELFQDYNNIGMQNGGWTLSWQGIEGNTFWQGENKANSGATSVLDGLKNLLPNATFVYPHYQDTSNQAAIDQTRQNFLQDLANQYPDMNASNTVIVGVVGEMPYAEFMGDVGNPYCTDDQDATNGCQYNLHLNPYLPLMQNKTLNVDYAAFAKQVIAAVKQKDAKIPLITTLFSGRPMIITKPLEDSNAFIAAWLPGTSGGQAVANAIFGNYLFCNGNSQTGNNQCVAGSPNTLSLNWVRNTDQLKDYPVYTQGTGFVAYNDPLFKIDYGLATNIKN